MKPNSPPEKKKLSMKTRLIVILVVFVMINIIFYVGFEASEDSQDDNEIIQDSELTEDAPEEQVYAKFNPPKP
jgi:flagellar basal body-associated protein FliL